MNRYARNQLPFLFPKAEVRTWAANSEFQMAVPITPLNREYLQELSRIFRELGFIRQAGYLLFQPNENEISYLILVDLVVLPQKREGALRGVAECIQEFARVRPDADYPVDFAHWDSICPNELFEDYPELVFFTA